MSKLSQIGTLTILTGLLLVGFQNCGSSEMSAQNKAASNSGVTAGELEKRYKEIQELIAADQSCAADADCAVLAVGIRHCGGPSGFMITSNFNSHLPSIQSLLQQYEARESQYYAENEFVGSCVYLLPPQVSCQLSLCKTSPSNGIQAH